MVGWRPLEALQEGVRGAWRDLSCVPACRLVVVEGREKGRWKETSLEGMGGSGSGQGGWGDFPRKLGAREEMLVPSRSRGKELWRAHTF